MKLVFFFLVKSRLVFIALSSPVFNFPLEQLSLFPLLSSFLQVSPSYGTFLPAVEHFVPFLPPWLHHVSCGRDGWTKFSPRCSCTSSAQLASRICMCREYSRYDLIFTYLNCPRHFPPLFLLYIFLLVQYSVFLFFISFFPEAPSFLRCPIPVTCGGHYHWALTPLEISSSSSLSSSLSASL